VSGSEAVEKSLGDHKAYIMAETLAVEWRTGQDDALYQDERTVGEEHWVVEFRKAVS
jgi:hypothetical protein